MYEKAFELFRVVQIDGSFRADYFTISTVLSACEGSSSFVKGIEVHAHVLRSGLECILSVNTELIGFYSKFGTVKDVVVVYESMSVRDVITWTEMITDNRFVEGYFDSHVSHIRKPHVWGGEPELFMASHVLRSG